MDEFDFDAFVAKAREAQAFATKWGDGDVMVAWTPDMPFHYRYARSWLAKTLPSFENAPFVVELTWDGRIKLWTDMFGYWSPELVSAIFAQPSDADPPVDPTPMHQPAPIPVPELDWQQKEQAEHDLQESNRKAREEIKRILGQ